MREENQRGNVEGTAMAMKKKTKEKEKEKGKKKQEKEKKKKNYPFFDSEVILQCFGHASATTYILFASVDVAQQALSQKKTTDSK
jgi:hypothetical protein